MIRDRQWHGMGQLDPGPGLAILAQKKIYTFIYMKEFNFAAGIKRLESKDGQKMTI